MVEQEGIDDGLADVLLQLYVSEASHAYNGGLRKAGPWELFANYCASHHIAVQMLRDLVSSCPILNNGNNEP